MLGTGSMRKDVLISWIPPASEWIKLNTDGCSKSNPGFTRGGGIIRNNVGRWLGVFLVHIGNCDATMTECWVVYKGLRYSWEKGFKQVILEVDSTLVARWFSLTETCSNHYFNLV